MVGRLSTNIILDQSVVFLGVFSNKSPLSKEKLINNPWFNSPKIENLGGSNGNFSRSLHANLQRKSLLFLFLG